MALSDGRIHTAVVLQGGGALGAYEFGVLKALYEQRPGFEPLAVAGISIGAVTAAVLGGAEGDPVAALERLWCEELTVSAPWPLDRFLPAVERSLAVLANPASTGRTRYCSRRRGRRRAPTARPHSGGSSPRSSTRSGSTARHPG